MKIRACLRQPRMTCLCPLLRSFCCLGSQCGSQAVFEAMLSGSCLPCQVTFLPRQFCLTLDAHKSWFLLHCSYIFCLRNGMHASLWRCHTICQFLIRTVRFVRYVILVSMVLQNLIGFQHASVLATMHHAYSNSFSGRRIKDRSRYLICSILHSSLVSTILISFENLDFFS